MLQTSETFLHKKFTRLYLLALSAVALLTIGGQVVMQHSLLSQLNDSKVINVAGRQRMLSQQITKTALLLSTTQDPLKSRDYLATLDEALTIWRMCHLGLKEGNLAHLNIPVQNSEVTQTEYLAIDPFFSSLYTNAARISAHFHQVSNPKALKGVEENIAALLKAEPIYLRGMDRIVQHYTQEAADRVNHSRRIEGFLLYFTLLVLALEALFIFRPAVLRLKHTIRRLLQAEHQAQLANAELSKVNQSLLQTRVSLLKATKEKHQQELTEQKRRSAYLLEGQEEERKRVAKEIHDGLGQMLTALKFGIEKVSDSISSSEKAQKDIASLRNLLTQTIAEARAISFDLMPSVLYDFGIASALKLLTGQLASGTGKHITFHTNWNNQRLPKNMEIGLYRIAQEALNNAVKYAKAEKITVDLFAKKKYIHLKISDNGQGFDFETILIETQLDGTSHGLRNMKERVSLLNGRLKTTSTPATGTYIHVKIPCPTPAT